MKSRTHIESRSGTGLRTRFTPRSRIGQGLVSVAPWLDVLLLFLFFLVSGQQVRLQPGVRVRLPEARFRDGAAGDVVMVVLSVRDPGTGRTRDLVFFDDVRYRVEGGAQTALLRRALAAKAAQAAAKGGGVTLTLQADRGVSHGTVTDIMNMALESGVTAVNVGTRPLR
jgi:biopolymer transport protein ExbD